MPLNVSFDYNFNEIPPLADGDEKSAVRLTSYMQSDKRRVSMPPKDCSAVEVRRLRYLVGRRKKAKVILSGINMTVPEGAIYGLLGPSGSGKTTLLKSVVGQLTPTEGWVKVFGFQPNQSGSQIPGAAIGYMPQELAVYEEFTIKETLWYFGRLYRIPRKIIKERIEFLLTFLDLPRSKRLIFNMSGGQKRRVSLASALVHSPPLLILDEPTVGVDPLLRQSIWQHLVTLTQTEKITVIVTTHYIEEARRANIVGLMRRGKLLAENTPDELMAKHNSESLEDVFLKLCVSDTMRRAQKFASMTGLSGPTAINGSTVPTPEIQTKQAHEAIEMALDEKVAVEVVSGNQIRRSSVDGSQSCSSESRSPDEGVNIHSTGSSQQDSSDASSGERTNSKRRHRKLTDARNCKSSTSSTSSAESAATHSNEVSPSTQGRSSVGSSEATTLDAGSLGHMTGAPTDRAIAEQIADTAQQQHKHQPPPPSKKFQLKSLLKIGSSKFNQPEAASKEQLKSLEKRRQSGTHFIEQLISKYNHDQTQQEPHKRAPLDQILSCDTDTVGKNAGPTGGENNNRLVVPKISIHHGEKNNNLVSTDSGASSNASSQNHSPIGPHHYSSQFGHPNHHPYNPHHDNLLAASYANHSYQPSECGSTSFNDLAMVQHSSANSKLQSSHDAMLDEDVVLDPELFLNPADLSTMSPGNKYDYKKRSLSEYCDTINTITWKNYIRLKRNVPLLLFQFVLPAIQVILFCICVGNDPFDIPVAVVNEESAADSIAALSTQFLRSIDAHLVRQVNFSNLDTAIASVRQGHNWGVIHIPENFTISIHKRFAGLEGEIDDQTLENSTIKVYPDMTNQPIGHAMEVAFRRAYNDLSKQTFEFLGLNPALSDPPIRMEGAIYGKVDMQNYLQYMSPGVLISISYIMATGLTSLAFIIERRDGLYDRTLAAGVDHVQILLSHSVVQLVVMIVQISLVVFFTFVIYKVPTNGPFGWVFLLLLLQGLAGMSFGLMVSAICKEENTAIMMILGTFYPNLLLAGVIWPIEAIPYWLRWFSYLQPQTLPTQSLRDLIVRGWSIDQPGVWSGFAVTSVWLILFLAISCVAFRIRK